MFGATYLTNLIRARMSGQAVPLGAGLVVNPDGSVGTPGGGFGTPSPAPITQPVLNQANPAFTAGMAGLPGSPSGNVPAGAPTPSPSHPALSAQAQAYRNRTMGQPSVTLAPQTVTAAAPTQGLELTTDQLNQMSLAAAQQGRTYWNPNLNVQPGGNVTNALTLPPGANQSGGMIAGNALVPGNVSGTANSLTGQTDQQLAQLNAYQNWQRQQQMLYGGGGP